MEYRKEIDGLRAIAVLSVVLYHAGINWLPGGFVGVDVFFVISGYLITQILSRDIQAGTFSILHFYERRARRIFPALFLVVLVTISASLIWALPEQVESTSVSAIAALFSVSNFYFWQQSGYFAPATDFMPLLHTWSLGVEEQFYLIFPLFLLILVRLRLSLFTATVGLIIPTFAAALWLSEAKPAVAFYLLPARMWELGLGSCLAFLPSNLEKTVTQPSVLRESGAFLGLTLILTAVFNLRSDMTFPGWAALLPCLGAALIILCAQGGGVIQNMLSSPVMRFFGLISYSLYLWHWPVLVFTRMLTADAEPGLVSASVAVALSITLATLSWRYVEIPFRKSGYTSFPVLAKSLAITGLITIALASTNLINNGFPDRLPNSAKVLLASGIDIDKENGSCHSLAQGSNISEACRFGSKDVPVSYVIIGDSHAAAIRAAFTYSPALSTRAGEIWSHGACPYLPKVRRIPSAEDYHHCDDFKTRVSEALRTNPEITHVILAGRWAVARSGIAPEIGGSYRTYLRDNETTALTASETEAAFDRGIVRALDEITALGKTVILVGVVPEPGFDVPRMLALADFNGHPGGATTLDADAVKARAALADASLAALAARYPNGHFLPIWDLFCTNGICSLLREGKSVYSDDDHITFTMAAKILPQLIAPRLEAILKDSKTPLVNRSRL